MIKVAFFDTKDYDKESFEKVAAARDVEIKYLETKLTEHTAELARGCDAVCVFVNDTVNAAVIELRAKLRIARSREESFNQSISLCGILMTPPPHPPPA